MRKFTSSYRRALRALGAVSLCATSAVANVNLQLRPVNQSAAVGQFVDIGLFAVSDNTNPQFMASLGIILAWDSARLELVGINNDDDGYAWLNSFFPDDRGLDRVNDDCPNETFCTPYTGLPFNDGDAYYEAWGQFSPGEPPQAVPGQGLLITKFRFRTLRSGTARVQFVAQLGEFTHTRVLSGIVPGREITGDLGPAVMVTIASCAQVPEVSAAGSRYLSVTPTPGTNPVAIWVSGDPADPTIACVGRFVQPGGDLGDNAVFLTPDAWGTVLVHGEEIRPGSYYYLNADCGTGDNAALSPGSGVRTWTWGDADNNGAADADDMLLVLDASRGIFHTTRQAVDLAGCDPDGVIDADDILSVLDAVLGLPYPCPRLCDPSVSLGDWPEFVSCISGPDVVSPEECRSADLDGNGYVDLRDSGEFQNAMQAPSEP